MHYHITITHHNEEPKRTDYVLRTWLEAWNQFLQIRTTGTNITTRVCGKDCQMSEEE